MLRWAIGGSLACAIGAAILAGGALAAVPHTVLPGESLWSISAANGLTTRTVAVYNGLAEDAHLMAGTTVLVPTVSEGAAALASGAPAPGVGSAPLVSSAPAPAGGSVPGMGYVPSPYGNLPLRADAAGAWNAMRAEALSTYGVDLYPGGPMSAYRTYEQQGQLYDAFLAGYGAPANPPGTSSHEAGTAVDVATPEMRSVIDQIGGKYGWSKVHGPDEWWHVDYVG
jgi:hypothetical protein